MTLCIMISCLHHKAIDAWKSLVMQKNMIRDVIDSNDANFDMMRERCETDGDPPLAAAIPSSPLK